VDPLSRTKLNLDSCRRLLAFREPLAEGHIDFFPGGSALFDGLLQRLLHIAKCGNIAFYFFERAALK